MNIQENQKKYGVQIVLELIGGSKLFYDEYVKAYPTNLANAMSFAKNPNCTCRNALIKHYNENKKEVDDFTIKFLEVHPSELAIDQFLQKHANKNVVGTIVKIDKSPEAFKDITNKMQAEKWVFRQMSVAVEGDNYVLFFV
tara:strand:+ start:31370 stop:31792 length:423 start_codon:yes stop_codon:yes gene_type:complete